jgi:hypothetical protein
MVRRHGREDLPRLELGVLWVSRAHGIAQHYHQDGLMYRNELINILYHIHMLSNGASHRVFLRAREVSEPVESWAWLKCLHAGIYHKKVADLHRSFPGRTHHNLGLRCRRRRGSATVRFLWE